MGRAPSLNKGTLEKTLTVPLTEFDFIIDLNFYLRFIILKL